MTNLTSFSVLTNVINVLIFFSLLLSNRNAIVDFSFAIQPNGMQKLYFFVVSVHRYKTVMIMLCLILP